MKALRLFCLVSVCMFFSISAEKIKMYAITTPSHAILALNWFLPSFEKYLIHEYSLIIDEYTQECSSGEFDSPGFDKTALRKIETILKAIDENWGSYFIFSDVDIQFFSSLESAINTALSDHDIVFQRDHPNGLLCTGFFVCRANEKTKLLWQAAQEYLQKTPFICDQRALNAVIKTCSQINGLSWGYLPTTFFGGGTFNAELWHPGMDLPIPEHPYMHHANWTKGIAYKLEQLAYVKKIINARAAD